MDYANFYIPAASAIDLTSAGLAPAAKRLEYKANEFKVEAVRS